MAPRNEIPSEDWQVQYAEIKPRAAHLYRTREWADCTFHFPTTDGSLDAHKLILAMASPVFAAMFYGTVGDQESPVTITDIDLPTFSALLQYIYTDETDVSDAETAINLYKAANKYILPHLEKTCLDYLFDHLNSNDVCQIYEFARLFGENELENECLKMFSMKTQVVLKGSGFCKAAHDTVKKILSMDALDIESEVNLFNALLEYLDHFKKNNNGNMAAHSIKDGEIIECLEFRQDTHASDLDNQNETSDNMALKLSNNIFKEDRSILKGLIEEIRFLSMTPIELTRICESTKVLSEYEKMSICTNKFSPNITPMPVGFSRLREPRQKVQATIRYTLYNVRSLGVDVDNYSPVCYVRGLPWMILARKESVSNEYYLGVYLHCDPDGFHSVSEDWWSCKVEYQEMRLLSNNLGLTLYNCQIVPEKIFCSEDIQCGFPDFIKWPELLDPANNYIQNDSITLEVQFRTEPVHRYETI